jgi:hypothetical protein
VLVLDAAKVARELADVTAIRSLTTAIASGEAERARALAADLLERSIA